MSISKPVKPVISAAELAIAELHALHADRLARGLSVFRVERWISEAENPVQEPEIDSTLQSAVDLIAQHESGQAQLSPKLHAALCKRVGYAAPHKVKVS